MFLPTLLIFKESGSQSIRVCSCTSRFDCSHLGLWLIHTAREQDRDWYREQDWDKRKQWALSQTSVNISTTYYTFLWHFVLVQVPVPFLCSVNIYMYHKVSSSTIVGIVEEANPLEFVGPGFGVPRVVLIVPSSRFWTKVSSTPEVLIISHPAWESGSTMTTAWRQVCVLNSSCLVKVVLDDGRFQIAAAS